MSFIEIIEGLNQHLEAQARAIMSDHPVLGALSALLQAGSSEIPAFAGNGAFPVLLVEPVGAVLGQPRQPGAPAYDYRLALVRMLGMSLVNEARMPNAHAWSLAVTDGQIELIDPTGTPIARARLDAADDWLATARQAHRVAVIYGTLLGVRPPAGTSSEGYTQGMRRDELTNSLLARSIAWAAVPIALPQNDTTNHEPR